MHKGESFPGQHVAIVEGAIFDRVQSVIARDQRERRARKARSSPFTGKVFDMHGNRLTPTHSKNRHGRTYRYYVASKLQQGGSAEAELKRFPAAGADALLHAARRRLSPTGEAQPELLVRATLAADSIELVLPARLLTTIRRNLAGGENVAVEDDNPELIRWTIPAVLKPRGGRSNVEPVERNAPNRDPVLINALRRAHRLIRRDAAGLPTVESLSRSRYECRLIRVALLSPRLQRDIIDGRQPPMLRLEDIVLARFPASWAAQERVIRLAQGTDGLRT